jgi:hypothetical protein
LLAYLFKFYKRKHTFMKMNMMGDIYVEMLNWDNDNQDERNYILRTHMEMNINPTYEHEMDAKKKNQNT